MRFLLVFIIIFANKVSAEAFYTAPSAVKSVSLGDIGVRVKLINMEDVRQPCATHTDWYMLSNSIQYIDKAYSTFLTSKLSSMPVNFQISGCVSYGGRQYPKITHVYFCDTKLCS